MNSSPFIILALLVTTAILWSPKVRGAKTWKAMTTPLASIIGSGFLVLGPILDSAYGMYAPLVMAGLCIGAYLYGVAIRYNIKAIELLEGQRGNLVDWLENASSWVLGFAYFISVAYYLNLFGAFGVNLTVANDPLHAKMLTSAAFLLVVLVGWVRGFKSLESMEYVSVTVKLAIIAGLLAGLGAYFYTKAAAGHLVFNPSRLTAWPAITLAFGLIITVQGFETSRYLTADYDSKTRIRSMKWAQWLSAAIYMAYILLLAYLFTRDQTKLSETGIVDMMTVVSPILPVLLVAAALAAQFSAAIADTAGSGGLIAELTSNRVSARVGYAILTGTGLLLTWSSGIFEIISYASRAFAVYYMLQALIAAVTAWQRRDRIQSVGFAMLAVLGALIVGLGKPVEH